MKRGWITVILSVLNAVLAFIHAVMNDKVIYLLIAGIWVASVVVNYRKFCKPRNCDETE